MIDKRATKRTAKKRGYTNEEFLRMLDDLRSAGRTPDEALEETLYYDEGQYKADELLRRIEEFEGGF